MRPFLIKLFIFSCIGILLYLIFLCLLAVQIIPWQFKRAPGIFGGLRYSNLRWQEAENQKNIDVLVLGSSHAYRGFHTDFFNKNEIKMFNLGSSNQTPNLSFLYLQNYAPTFKPKLVILECFWEMYDYQGIEAAADAICNHPKSDFRRKVFFAEPDLTTFNSLLMTEIRRLMIPLEKEKTIESNIYTYIPGGYVSCPVEGSVEEEIRFSEKLNPTSLAYAEKIIQYCNKNNIKILLVLSPVSHYYFKKIKNYSALIEPFNKISNKYQVPLIDFHQLNYSLFDDQKHFADSHHLNDSGVLLMNQLLLDQFLSGYQKSFYKH